MPDYSDEEIDKASDDVSESDTVDDEKPNKFVTHSDTDYVRFETTCQSNLFNNLFFSKSKHYTDINDQYLRQRGKFGHDNPAFIDDTNISKSTKKSFYS